MSFTYRENQNTPLTWAQLDGNFREVESVQGDVLNQVEVAKVAAESAAASSSASQLSAELAEEMARISVVRWCGNSTNPPITRLDGSPLEISDEYGNLTDHLRYNWTGTAWVALNSSAQQLEARLADPSGAGNGAVMLGRGVASIETIADLLTATHKETLTYRVTSYRGGWAAEAVYIGPLGGGDFKFLSGSTLPADGGVVFEVPLGRVVRICSPTNVEAEWYGAIGGGGSDDTAALRLACRSTTPYENDYGYTFTKSGGREIALRSGGNYKITQPIYLRKGDWLKGSGFTACRLFTNTVGIGQMIYMGYGLIDGVKTKDPGGLIPKVSDICFAETVGGVSAIYLDGISGWDVRNCWAFVDVFVRAVGITNDGFLINCVADNNCGHLAIFEGTGDGYHTGQTTLIEGCNTFKSRYGGIKLDGVSDVTIKGCFFNFIPFYGVYTGTVKQNSRIKLVDCTFKSDISGVGMDPSQQHVRVTAPTKGFAIINCNYAYSRNADIQANFPVQVSGGYSTAAVNDSIICVGGRSKISGMTFEDTGRYPIRSTVRIAVNGCDAINPFTAGLPINVYDSGSIYLSRSANKSTVFNCTRDDDKGPVLSTNGLNGIRSSGNTSEGDIDVLHYTGTGVNYTDNERSGNPVALWRNVELLRNGYTRWIDLTGRLRIKNGDPTSETDGTVVGAQA